jgi:toxin YoeB
MSKLQFTEQAWEEYVHWLNQDEKYYEEINKLISDIMRNGAAAGEGKTEMLKGALHGFFSRRINEKDRLIYKVLENDVVEIYSCRGHYEDT